MSRGLILITGATGYIGSHAAALALAAGYKLRIAIRRPEQADKLRALFSDHADSLEFAVVPNFLQPGAFNEAVAGADYVLHVASPMPGKGTDFKKDYLGPAVQGTLSVLDAAQANASTRKVLIVSSILALAPLGILSGEVQPNGPAQENTGEVLPVDPEAEFTGPNAHGNMYQGSKILAHQATRDWLADKKPSFPVLTFHPSFVIGPSLIQTSAQDIDAINGYFFNFVRSGEPQISAIFVDVRDVAEALIKAVDTDVPSGKEFILSGVPTSWNKIAETVQEFYPSQGFKLKAPLDEPPVLAGVTKGAEELLGIKWKSQEELVRGVIDQQLSFAAST